MASSGTFSGSWSLFSINLKKFQNVFLDVGCGKMPYKEYILKNSPVEIYHGLDIETAMEYEAGVKPDFEWDGVIMPFENETYS
ncbi:MAG: class I SAM-dependent methyltransferase, partial [Chryseobacterium sp.]